ncbi:MAG: DUF4097 domain-containing protein [Clostridiales bacterium]|nr:DUF4097 domain-containing protein [Clostridiales bacterium]
MSKTIKIWLIIAASLVILGVAIFAISMASVGWDFTKLSTGNYETNTYDVTEEFADISIKTDTADIVFMPSDDGKCKVICYEESKVKHSVSVVDGVLTVDTVDARKWYDHIGIHFGSPKITVYLPEGEYSSLKIEESTGDIEISHVFGFEDINIFLSTGDVNCYASAKEDVKIKASTGDIRIENISAGSLNISVSTGKVTVSGATVAGDITVGVSTGKVYLTDIACNNLISTGSTGDISLKNVVATEKFSIERSTGDVKFDGSDAAKIFVKTNTGDVKGSLLTDKVFITETDTGRVDVPQTTTGGRCEITSDTGDISIEIKK